MNRNKLMFSISNYYDSNQHGFTFKRRAVFFCCSNCMVNITHAHNNKQKLLTLHFDDFFCCSSFTCTNFCYSNCADWKVNLSEYRQLTKTWLVAVFALNDNVVLVCDWIEYNLKLLWMIRWIIGNTDNYSFYQRENLFFYGVDNELL